MQLLLDTHVWLWMLTAPEQLRAQRPLLEDPGTRMRSTGVELLVVG